jgi:uncharacterized UPF0146 family protein
VEIGVGANFDVAQLLSGRGVQVTCTDIRPCDTPAADIDFLIDDIFRPWVPLYQGAELLYAIRPGVEMVPPMIDLACRIDADLLVYHLGDERYQDGGEIIECGVPLHRYRHARTGK